MVALSRGCKPRIAQWGSFRKVAKSENHYLKPRSITPKLPRNAAPFLCCAFLHTFFASISSWSSCILAVFRANVFICCWSSNVIFVSSPPICKELLQSNITLTHLLESKPQSTKSCSAAKHYDPKNPLLVFKLYLWLGGRHFEFEGLVTALL